MGSVVFHESNMGIQFGYQTMRHKAQEIPCHAEDLLVIVHQIKMVWVMVWTHEHAECWVQTGPHPMKRLGLPGQAQTTPGRIHWEIILKQFYTNLLLSKWCSISCVACDGSLYISPQYHVWSISWSSEMSSSGLCIHPSFATNNNRTILPSSSRARLYSTFVASLEYGTYDNSKTEK